MLFTFTYYTSNERSYFSLRIKNLFFHFYLLNKDFSLNTQVKLMKLSTYLKNIHMEGTVSQIFNFILSFYFIKKNGKLLEHFWYLIFYIS